MKVCKKCKEQKEYDCFYKKTDKRQSPPLVYLNNICIECARNYSNEFYRKIKDDPIYKDKNRERARQYRVDNREVVLLKEKKRRQTIRYKTTMKLYLSENREYIKQKDRPTKEKWRLKHPDLVKKNRDEQNRKKVYYLTDGYIKDILKKHGHKGPITKKDIEIRRIEILIKRINKEDKIT